jgi:deferrochelatase/peroxidase EfeB
MADPTLDYADVQGTILRGYRVDLARHFVLSVTDPAGARALIGSMVDGTEGVPQVTTAARWTEKPECFVNVGFTCQGLSVLGVADTDLATFDGAFKRGAADAGTAKKVGDVGDSAPSSWIGGMGDGTRVHLLISLWVSGDEGVLERVSAKMRHAFAGCMEELSAHDAQALPDNQVHFGYRDNIAQPTVVGAPPRKRQVPDDQPAVATGEFLLGYGNEIGGTYSQTPAPLSLNGSYAAFRILEQDVAGFEALLEAGAAQAGTDVETLAAKFCGRWRNGNPLELAPTAPGEVLPMEKLNNFTYVGMTAPAQDDTLGTICPIGSHIRRNNPRNEQVIGDSSVNHRIVRRAMPYGPAYDPQKPDSTPRGLVGWFINASLLNQFEFLMAQWNQVDSFVKAATAPGGVPAGNAYYNISGEDVFLGVNDPTAAGGTSFTLAYPGSKGTGNKEVTGFSRTITTRGSAYCFLPSVAGLKYLAGLSGSTP